MRVLGKYFKMPKKTRKNAVSLQSFKKKVGCVLESISQLSSVEQSEAYGFLQSYVNYLGSRKGSSQNQTVPDSTSSERDSSEEQSTPFTLDNNSTSSPNKESSKKLNSVRKKKTVHKTQNSKRHAVSSCLSGQEDSKLSSDSSDSCQPDSASEKHITSEKSVESSELLTCEECGAKLRSRRAMLVHLDRHPSYGVSCWACHKTFNSVAALKFHYTDFCNNNNKKLVCPQCEEIFTCRTHYTNHMEGHKRNNCQVCPSVFTNRKNLVAHMAESHSIVMLADAAFVCNVQGCERRFVKRSTLHRHMQIRHTSKGQHVCITCGLYLDGEDAYKSHVETHKRWTCQECSESFTRRQQYLVHMMSHKESRYKCMTCSMTIPTKGRALEHKKSGHEVEGINVDFACDVCDEKFPSPSELRDHSSIHKTPDLIACKFCGKTFSSRKTCNSHIRSHHSKEVEVSGSEASLICEHCGKQFRQPCFLAKHLKSVHNEQIFSCSFCDHKTNNEVNMRRHCALHTVQEQQYVCDQCGASFQALSNLKDHNLFVHSDERNFTCEVCKKSFKRKTDLTRHQRSHSDDRMYVCHCKQSYKFIAHLRRHQEAAHKTVTASRKVQRLVPDADGKLVERPKPSKEKKTDKDKKDAKCKLETSFTAKQSNTMQETLTHALENNHPQQVEQGPAAMQLLSVDNEVVTLSVADLQIADPQVDPLSIQVAYDGLSFSDSKAQLVYTTSSPGSSQVMSLQLPQFELVEPNLHYDTNSSPFLNNPHGSMLMSITTNDQPSQPVMTLLTGLDQSNPIYNSQTDSAGTMTEPTSVFSNNILDSSHNCVGEVKSVEDFSGPVLGHKTSQSDMSTMTDMYGTVYDSQTNMCVNQPSHQELITMSFPSLDPSSNLLLPSDNSWHISQESVTLPQYSTC